MLVIWSEEDPEASIENLKSILQELNITSALEVLNENNIKTEEETTGTTSSVETVKDNEVIKME